MPLPHVPDGVRRRLGVSSEGGELWGRQLARKAGDSGQVLHGAVLSGDPGNLPRGKALPGQHAEFWSLLLSVFGSALKLACCPIFLFYSGLFSLKKKKKFLFASFLEAYARHWAEIKADQNLP